MIPKLAFETFYHTLFHPAKSWERYELGKNMRRKRLEILNSASIESRMNSSDIITDLMGELVELIEKARETNKEPHLFRIRIYDDPIDLWVLESVARHKRNYVSSFN